MRFALTWQRLVKGRYTEPAKAHARGMRETAERMAPTPVRSGLIDGANHIDRLANMLDELVRPTTPGVDRPLDSAKELRDWIAKDMRENPEVWRAVMGAE